MSRFLMTLFSVLFAYSLTAHAQSYYGRYKAEVNTISGPMVLEFLVNSDDDLAVISSSDNFPAAQVKRVELSNSLGPSIEYMTIEITYGSDEETYVTTLALAALGEGHQREVTLMTAWTLFEDGPNDLTTASKDGVHLYKWSRRQKQYIAVPAL